MSYWLPPLWRISVTISSEEPGVLGVHDAAGLLFERLHPFGLRVAFPRHEVQLPLAVADPRRQVARRRCCSRSCRRRSRRATIATSTAAQGPVDLREPHVSVSSCWFGSQHRRVLRPPAEAAPSRPRSCQGLLGGRVEVLSAARRSSRRRSDSTDVARHRAQVGDLAHDSRDAPPGASSPRRPACGSSRGARSARAGRRARSRSRCRRSPPRTRWPDARRSRPGVPTCSMRPSEKTAMRSLIVSASSWSWVT